MLPRLSPQKSGREPGAPDEVKIKIKIKVNRPTSAKRRQIWGTKPIPNPRLNPKPRLRLSQLGALVERRGDYFALYDLATNFNAQFSALGGMGERDVGEGDVLLEKGRGRAAGDLADGLAVRVKHLVAVAGDAALNGFKADEDSVEAALFLLHKGGVADELSLFQFDEAIETGLPGSNGVGDFVSVEGERAFEAERVARAEAAGQNAELFTGGEKFVPDALPTG